MIKVTEVEKMMEAEKLAFAHNVTVDDLIERVADKIFAFIKERYGAVKEIAVAVGCGNNGSDALSVAIRLIKDGKEVFVYVAGGKPNEYNQKRRKEIEALGVKIMPADCFDGNAELIIDGIFGTGFSLKQNAEAFLLIERINASNAAKLSIDIPSGLSAQTGETMGVAVKADVTLALEAVKIGLLAGIAKNYTGEIVCADIGLDVQTIGYIAEASDAEIAKRERAAHKGNFGKISVIGGSDCMPGAPLMSYESAVAASKCGAGVVRLCVGEQEKCAYKSRVKEQTLFYFPEKDGYICFDKQSLDEIIAWSDVIVIGMGMGKNPDLPVIIQYLSANFTATLVIDADGLNALARDVEIIANHVGAVILTPHLGEFARLFPDIRPYEIDKIKKVAQKYSVTLVVKSANTTITDGKDVWFTTSGTPALAKGGSGDVLAGMTAAFAAIMEPISAGVCACYHFGRAGERASSLLKSEVSVLASDVIIQINQ